MNFPRLLNQLGTPVIDADTWQPLLVVWSLSEAPHKYLDHPLQTVAHDAEMERWPKKARNLVERTAKSQTAGNPGPDLKRTE